MAVSLVPLPKVVEVAKEAKPRLVEIILPAPEPIQEAIVKIPKPVKKPEPKPEPKVERKVERPKEVIVAEVKQTVKQTVKEKLSTLDRILILVIHPKLWCWQFPLRHRQDAKWQVETTTCSLINKSTIDC